MLATNFFLALIALVAPLITAVPVSAEKGYFPSRCFPNPCKGITHQNSTYICGDPRLGPVKLPNRFPLQTAIRTYARFGSLCPAEFLDKWASSVTPEGKYIYPPANGFLADTESTPIKGNVTLPVGQKLDRFGSEYGTFLGPLGAPYIERALPPSNLATYDGEYPYNYHVYEVVKKFEVGLGPIAPWFEQPGLGSQMVTYTNVMGLVEGGFLRRLDKSEYDEAVEYSNDYTPGPQDDPPK
ncbi:hypothetical protein FE257_011092 [Aspergillus nanangensis]|uniref:TNT domain-containing protein n=1 Tax=Aspergillus nanangensis TaxID=2582783 RepID=A0AAD4CI01_ASPNN|nr:hypothetical protein FE257_011092 [Aspergillus nanangensis]